ncbi:MAG: hypothetical protein M1821_004454 [Bathelium mastoideum]|nr:MAG: hypothetical protein M1821_004454 [Bathelium mastoideum]
MENLIGAAEDRDQTNERLSRAILGDTGGDDVDKLLYNLCLGLSPPELVAEDFIVLANTSSDTVAIVSNLGYSILSLACDYAFLQPQLVDLIRTMLPASPSEIRIQFIQEFSKITGDYAHSNHALLFESRNRTSSRIQDYIHLHRFFARLLGAIPNEGPVRIEDAFYIVSIALEDHSESHEAPDIDISAAAQYMIWAAKVFLEGCCKQDESGENEHRLFDSPIWSTRGKLWTGKSALSKDRWYFWKNRLLNTKLEDEVKESTKLVSGSAVRAMIIAENQ